MGDKGSFRVCRRFIVNRVFSRRNFLFKHILFILSKEDTFILYY